MGRTTPTVLEVPVVLPKYWTPADFFAMAKMSPRLRFLEISRKILKYSTYCTGQKIPYWEPTSTGEKPWISGPEFPTGT